VLARVEKQLAGEPVLFIGVHSPKFPNERDEAMVREAVRRYGVTHPVVVDSGHRIWQEFGVRAWPTLVVIDPFGYVLGDAPGEAEAEPLRELLEKLLAMYRDQGAPLATEPLPVRPEPPAAGALAHPGKLLVAGERLYVADTGHHQIVELSLAGTPARELRRFGAGAPGLLDGPAERALFSHPNGLALDAAAGVLWVADTGNHAVRRLALATGQVTTEFGDGERGSLIPPGQVVTDRAVALRSPWDLAWDPVRARLLVAMAGSHQLFVIDPAAPSLRVLAGSGREARLDGPPERAAFAQPSGLALSGDRLYVADSEISALREVALDSGQVRTVAGGDLFDFGDVDGAGDAVRLQHPMGIAAAPADGRLFVADSFNHKIKAFDPRARTVRTLYGSGQALRANLAADAREPTLPEQAGPEQALFWEPEGVSVADGRLYVADTNNHRVVAIDLASGRTALVVG